MHSCHVYQTKYALIIPLHHYIATATVSNTLQNHSLGAFSITNQTE